MTNCVILSLWVVASLTILDITLDEFLPGINKPMFVNCKETQGGELDADWSKMVIKAFIDADVVVLGSVRGIRNYMPVDGGFGYDVEVSEIFKGKHIKKISFRAGGWAYVIKYAIGEKILLFLKESKTFMPSDKFVLLKDKNKQPIALRIEENEVIGLRGEAKSEWGRHSLDEYLSLLNDIQNK